MSDILKMQNTLNYYTVRKLQCLDLENEALFLKVQDVLYSQNDLTRLQVYKCSTYIVKDVIVIYRINFKKFKTLFFIYLTK